MVLPAEAFEDDAANYTSRQFWNNELIWKEIRSYLNEGDLISLGATNKYFRCKITQGLKRTWILIIKDEEDFKLQVKSKVENFQSSNLIILNRGTLSEDIIISGLITIISKCRNLKSLLFETHEFLQEKYAEIFRNKYVRNRLSKLTLLEIGRIRKGVEAEICNGKDGLATIDVSKLHEFFATYEFFPLIDMQLESFYYSEPNLNAPISFFQPELILCTSLCSLTSLTLEINIVGLKELQKLQFLRLDTLDLTITFPRILRPTVNANENLPNVNAINNEDEDLAIYNLINNVVANIDEEVIIDHGNYNENGNDHEDVMSDSDDSGSDDSDSDDSDSDESDSDESDDEGNLSTPITENLIPFLQNHLRTLKNIKIYSIGRFSLKTLFETFKHSKKIELLSFYQIGERIDKFLHEIDWSVICILSTLKGFKLKFGYEDHKTYFESDSEDSSSSEEDSDEDDEVQYVDLEIDEVISPKLNDWNLVLNSLPCKMEYISLCRFQYFGNQDDLSSAVISSIGKFENLRILAMEKCPDFFNDDTLQFICKTLTKLRKLKGEFHKVTDFGISGLKEDGSDSGVSLKNLKGLQKLVIYSGSGSSLDNKLCFTWAGLLRSVAFLELTRLKIMGSLKDAHMDGRKADSKDGHNFLKLIKQNPSLNEIGLSFYTPISLFREQVSKVNPRVHTTRLSTL